MRATPAHTTTRSQAVAHHALTGAQVDQRQTSSKARGKPSLNLAHYLDELNMRLRRHPDYLQGMRFPHPQPGSTPMLAAALAWEGPWEGLDVFMAVNAEVANDYDLAPHPAR